MISAMLNTRLSAEDVLLNFKDRYSVEQKTKAFGSSVIREIVSFYAFRASKCFIDAGVCAWKIMHRNNVYRLL